MDCSDREGLLSLIRQRPLGSRIWVRGLGRSMAPLLRSGDAVLLERCSEDAISIGDWAVLQADSDAPFAHVVVGLRPLQTATWLGRADAPGGVLLGRVVQVRRGKLVLPTTGVALWPAKVLRSAVLGLRGWPIGEAVMKRTRAELFSRRTARVRRWLQGDVTVRRLRPEDQEALLLFAGDYLPLSPAFVSERLRGRWQGPGFAVGAFAGSGRLVGFAWVDSYSSEGVSVPGDWIRSVYVAPLVRGMGVAERLVAIMLAEASRRGMGTLRADIRTGNTASVRLFRRCGFEPDTEELTERLNSARRAPPDDRLLVFKRDLGVGPGEADAAP